MAKGFGGGATCRAALLVCSGGFSEGSGAREASRAAVSVVFKAAASRAAASADFKAAASRAAALAVFKAAVSRADSAASKAALAWAAFRAPASVWAAVSQAAASAD